MQFNGDTVLKAVRRYFRPTEQRAERSGAVPYATQKSREKAFTGLKKYAVILGVILVSGIFCALAKLFFDFVGNPARAEKIYIQALADLNAQNYSNAYYQFSKVSYLSEFKPYAIYHRAECAKALNDYKSEQKQYYLLFNIYPKNELSLKSKYYFAIDIADSNPWLAQKYLEEIIQKAPESNYATGAKYQIANILNTKYSNSSLSSEVDKNEIEKYLREYLTTAPSGRWALKAAELWQNISQNLSDEDKNIIAETYMLYNLAQRAQNLLEDSDINVTWAKYAKAALQSGETGKAKSLIETGLRQQHSKAKEADKNLVITRYLQTQKDKEKTVDSFLSAAQGKSDLFLKSLKCKYTKNQNTQNQCYANILKYYDISSFSEPVLETLFMESIKTGQYSNAKKLGLKYLEKYTDNENTAEIAFWLGKINKHSGKTLEANEYFRKVILNYPDSYYAFRSYLQLNDIKNSIITTLIEPKNVIFPYYGKADATIIKLVEMGDLSIISQIYENDKFIQSWVLYEKGEKSRAMCIARDAMAKLNEKPEKSDLRWRLVYPAFMYDEMKEFAHSAGNNPVLMLSLTREESYFNPNAHSYVGASGLMQLMPATAKEINRIRGLGMETLDELKNSGTNLKLGNHYYNYLLKNLGENNILAVGAYNGGIGSISRWKQGLEYRDIDEFIEKIPYPETRTYIKKVFRTYWNYARLYL